MAHRDLLRLLWPYFRRRGAHFACAFVLKLAEISCLIAGPLLIKQAIDRDIVGRNLAGLRTTVLIYLVIQLLLLLTVYWMRIWLERTGQDMLRELRSHLLAHLLKLPMSFYDRITPGQLLTRTESDTQALRVLFTMTAVTLLGDVLTLLGMLAVMFWISWPLAAVIALLLPIMGGISLYFQWRIHPIFVEVRRLGAEVAGRLAEFIQAMPMLQAFARQRWAVADFQRLNKQKYDANLRGETLVVTWFNLLFSMQTVAFALILGLGGYWALAGLVTVGTLVMFLGYVRRLFQPLMRLSEQLSMIQRALAATERIYSLLSEPVVVEDQKEPAPWPGRGATIEFQNVWFRYDRPVAWASQPATEDSGSRAMPPVPVVDVPLPLGESWDERDSAEVAEISETALESSSPGPSLQGRGDGDETGRGDGDGWILRDVSFTVPAGKSCALVGPTGGGKTTIINLLLRFYDPQRGRILIDGVDLRHLSGGDLRRHVGVVPQDIYLFPGNLADNLALGRRCTEEALAAAARTTLAEPLIDQLPGGMQASLYERGANLSVGQRQLLSFTRALVSTPELLVLDEATSAVDPATEALLGEATRRLLAGRTSLIIAHRLSTIRHCDEILVIDQGRIAERGTHAGLVAAGGIYRDLSDLQKWEHRHVG